MATATDPDHENLDADGFKQLRESLGYTQVEFADLLGVSRPAIARAESRGPSPLVATRLELAQIKGLLVRKDEKRS